MNIEESATEICFNEKSIISKRKSKLKVEYISFLMDGPKRVDSA